MKSLSEIFLRNTTSVSSYSPAEAASILARYRLEAANSATGNLTGFDCPECKNKGYILFLGDDGTTPVSKPCQCMKTRTSLRKLAESNLSGLVNKYTFDSFLDKEDWQKKVKSMAEKYAANPQGWFFIGGQSGAGKTHICTAICSSLIFDKRCDVRYMPWRDVIQSLKRRDNDAAIDEFKSAEVLYIDDLFKTGRDKDGETTPTRPDIDVALEIINHRYIQSLSTIISTEKTCQELLKIDEALAGRIIERAGDFVIEVNKDIRKNQRFKKKAME